jgi:hypothetical protein
LKERKDGINGLVFEMEMSRELRGLCQGNHASPQGIVDEGSGSPGIQSVDEERQSLGLHATLAIELWDRVRGFAQCLCQPEEASVYEDGIRFEREADRPQQSAHMESIRVRLDTRRQQNVLGFFLSFSWHENAQVVDAQLREREGKG